jgi:hypothetical protein
MTSRLGEWEPSSLEDRLARLESLASIHQLAYRYALAVDSRDTSGLASLFAPDVKVGSETGRAALATWFDQILRRPKASVHYVVNHIVDFDGPMSATGVVYCRDELEWIEDGTWQVGALQYWDRYVNIDGEWCFERRRFCRWYLTDALTRPQVGAGVNDGHDPLRAEQLPAAFPTWGRFWEGADGESSE